MEEDYDILFSFKRLSKNLGLSSLDLMVSSCVPWINYISWIFYFMAFKKSAKKISSLIQKLEEFDWKHDSFEEKIASAGKGKYISTVSV